MDLITDSTRKVLGKLDSKHFLPIYPHSSAPCHNLNKSVLNLKKPEVSCYSVTHPLPVNRPSSITKPTINGMDPALCLVTEKRLWEKQKKDVLKYCSKNHVENIEDSEIESSNAFKVPFSVVLLADHFSKDPDEHFSNNYNSYYTGGNISSLNIASQNYLIFPKKDNGCVTICMKPASESASLYPKSDFRVESSTFSNDTVFQIESFNNYIISREKKKISLFSIQEKDSGLQIKKKFDRGRDIPYFSAAIHKKSFCTTAANRELDLFDIGKEKITLSGLVNPEENVHRRDCWSSAHFIDDNTLCFIDRSCIGFVDLRSKTTLAEKWSLSKVAEDCEEVFGGAKGNEGMQYITTSHQLLSLDPRSGFCQRFTHGITHSPAFITLPVYSLGTDKIFIGSQVCDSVIFIENSSIEGNCISSHPYMLPNLADTFHIARFNGYCLDNIVSSRFSMSLTGLAVIEDNEGLNLFRFTSVGDIFKQTLEKSLNEKDLDLREDDFQKLAQWEEECIKLSLEELKSCTVASVEKDSHIINYINSGNEYIEPVVELDFSKVPWRISKKELLSYCDYLAPKILEEWGLDDIEEWVSEELIDEEIKTELLSSDEEDVTEKVAKWMEKFEEDETESYYFPDSSEDEVISANPGQIEENNLLPAASPDNKKNIGLIAKKRAGF